MRGFEMEILNAPPNFRVGEGRGVKFWVLPLLLQWDFYIFLFEVL